MRERIVGSGGTRCEEVQTTVEAQASAVEDMATMADSLGDVAAELDDRLESFEVK